MTVATLAGAEADPRRLLKAVASQEALLAIAVIGLAIIVGLYNPRFLATRNLADVLLGNAYIAVAAVGMHVGERPVKDADQDLVDLRLVPGDPRIGTGDGRHQG